MPLLKKIVVGAHWTGVESRYCGMASTIQSPCPHGEGTVKAAGGLLNMTAGELALFAHSDNSLEASIGLATINSLIPPPEKNITRINALQYLADNGAGKKIAIFGHFPYINNIASSAEQMFVFELAPSDEEHSLQEVPDLLPLADMVAITSNSIINHTLEGILPHIKPSAFVMMLGPSTPLSPVLFDYGIQILAGVRIINKDLMFTSISQGAIFKQVKGVELVTMMP